MTNDTVVAKTLIADCNLRKYGHNDAGIVFGDAREPGNGLQPAAWPPCDFIAGSSYTIYTTYITYIRLYIRFQ